MAHPLSDTLALAASPERAGAVPHATATAGHLPLIAAWRRLAAHPLLPAADSGPDWLGPMLDTLGGGRPRLVVTQDGATGAITALVALEARGFVSGYPARVARNWRTDLSFAGTPLIAAEDAAGALAGFVTAACDRLGARVLFLRGIEADAAMMAAIEGAAARLGVGWCEIARHERAALRPRGEGFEAWLEANHPRKRRKEFRRLRARLAEAGSLTVHRLEAGEPVAPWMEEFLALERAGWKGKRGTAVGCDAAHSSMLRRALPALAARSELAFWKLALDGRPIAMLFAPLSGPRAWLCKIAHDEAFARYSPGVLLILEATRDLLARGDIALVDSCAVPGHPMIDRLWRDRLAIVDVAIAAPGTSPLLLAAVLAAECARRRLRHLAKTFYYSLLGRRVK
jgi:CelD/BcsL family acetyltransferase involved in cellulose biosynthesis